MDRFDRIARNMVARELKIGPGVILQGKQGIFRLDRGPWSLDKRGRPGEYNPMMEAGYTHFLSLESPRGKEYNFYWNPKDPDTLYWYKNHRTMVPMKFKNTELPPSLEEIRDKFRFNTLQRDAGNLYEQMKDNLLRIGKMAQGQVPEAAEAQESLHNAMMALEPVFKHIREAEEALS
jgi:hypothetical protein